MVCIYIFYWYWVALLLFLLLLANRSLFLIYHWLTYSVFSGSKFAILFFLAVWNNTEIVSAIPKTTELFQLLFNLILLIVSLFA